MPITIQELLASDTISQAVDKINFNFDQLILNGGGPAGPIGAAGPTGPIGGRGIRGERWYEDPNATATDPNTLIFTDLIEGDNYLNADGVVWKYNGTAWVVTTIDLTGPSGPAGSSNGFLFFGGWPGGAAAGNENVAYPTLMPSGTAGGADQFTNQAVPSLLIAGIPQNAPTTPGITYTAAYQISTAMMEKLDSSVVSTIIHQKDTGASAIKFMGGGAMAGENFVQDDIALLSGIKLTEDDTLNINVPKAATSPATISDLIGFNLNTNKRGQRFIAGKQINIISGVDTSSHWPFENSDITFTVNTSNDATPAKFLVETTADSSTALFELGGNITSPTTTGKTGRIYGAADNVRFVGGTEVGMRIGDNFMEVKPNNITIESLLGNVQINTNNNDLVVQAGTTGTVNLNGGDIYGNAGNAVEWSAPDIDLTGPDIKLGVEGDLYAINGLFVDNSSVTLGGTKLKGNVVWDPYYFSSPSPYNSTRQILLKEGFVFDPEHPPLIIQDVRDNTDLNNGIRVATGTGEADFVNSTEIYNAGVYVDSNSVDTIDIIGFKLDAEDSISNRDHTQFNAKRDTTEIGNRLRYVRRYLNVNPCIAGIKAPMGYTVEEKYMDATYLDIQFANTGATPDLPASASDDSFNFFLPDGAYEGQKLVLHITAAPSRTFAEGQYYDWPSVSGGGGAITIFIKSSAPGPSTAYTGIARMPVSALGSFPIQASEFLAEFIWSGITYETVISPSSPSGIRKRTMGWIMVSGPGIVNDTDGQYQAVSDEQLYL